MTSIYIFNHKCKTLTLVQMKILLEICNANEDIGIANEDLVTDLLFVK